MKLAMTAEKVIDWKMNQRGYIGVTKWLYGEKRERVWVEAEEERLTNDGFVCELAASSNGKLALFRMLTAQEKIYYDRFKTYFNLGEVKTRENINARIN